MNPAAAEQPAFSPQYKRGVFHSLWISQMVSMLGSGLTAFALRVWAFEQTESVTQFALITFFYGLPGILLSPIAGVWADRWNRRWVMILSDLGAGIATFFIWLLFVLNQLEVWHIYTAVILISLFNTIQQPAYAATIPMLVPKENLGRANGITQIGPALARIISPMLGGFLLVAIGLNGVAEIDLATFLFAMLVLFLIRIPRPTAADADNAEKETMRQQIAAGWRYVRERAGLLNILLLFMVIDFTQGMIVVLIAPLVLGFADASVLGTVFAVSGMGALLGAVAMGVWGGPKRRVHGVLGFSLLRSLLLFMGGLQPNAWLVAGASALYLFFSQIATGSMRTIWQIKVPQELQGRVFSVRLLVGALFFPLGQLLSGVLADKVFQPLLDADGLLAGNVGLMIGTGPGRGIGLMLIVLGIFNLVVTLFGYANPRIRRIEDEIPDAI